MNNREIRNAESLVSKLPRRTLIHENIKPTQQHACEFAARFVEKNKDLLNRLADK